MKRIKKSDQLCLQMPISDITCHSTALRLILLYSSRQFSKLNESCAVRHQIVTNFKKIYADTWQFNFLLQLPLKIPPHVKDVATLYREIFGTF